RPDLVIAWLQIPADEHPLLVRYRLDGPPLPADPGFLANDRDLFKGRETGAGDDRRLSGQVLHLVCANKRRGTVHHYHASAEVLAIVNTANDDRLIQSGNLGCRIL